MKTTGASLTKNTLLTGLCLFLIYCCLFWTTTAAAATTVKVGYDMSGSYLIRTAAGEYQGMDMEILYEISKYTNWHYEFVPFQNWGQAVSALENNQIDLLPTMLKSPEREKKLLFSTRRMGSAYIALVVPKGSTSYSYGDFSQLQGAKIGVRHNTVDAAAFAAWMQKSKFTCTTVDYNGQKDLLEALDEGQVDAAVLTYTGLSRSYPALAEFAPQDMYFALAPSKQDLYQELENAMAHISIIKPEFFPGLMEKYIAFDTNSRPVFSHKELKYLQQHGQNIRVALLRSSVPFSQEQSDKSFKGIIPDLLAKISDLSGLKFTYVPVSSQQEALQAVQDGKADLIGRMAHDIFFAEKNNLRYTTPFTYLTLVEISRKDTPQIQKIALQDPALQTLVSQNFNDGSKDIQDFLNLPCCIESLTTKKVDAIYCDSITANYFMNTHRASEYQLYFFRNNTFPIAFAISKDMDSQLGFILDKCIRYIKTDAFNSIVVKNTILQEHSLSMVFNQLPGEQIMLLVSILLFILVCLAYLSFSLWRKRGTEKRLATITIKNQQMHADMQAAVKINEAKDDFFSHISHDMRTPLNGIIGFTRLAAQTAIAPETKDYLAKIKISSDILLDLINDTLQLSKLERGKYISIQEEVNSTDYFSNLVTPIIMMAQEKELQVVTQWEQLTPATILVDKLSTQKIFLNILGNAVKFTPKGGTITINARTLPEIANAYQTQFTITDTGIGISEEFLPQIFEPFAQEHQKSTELQQGTGLGLTIVQQLIQLLGGTITVTSKLQQGTQVTFTLAFPYAQHQVPATGTTPTGNTGADSAPKADQQLAGLKLLICEDNSLNIEIAAKLLEHQGALVIRAQNGKEGVEAFKASAEGELDAILMDLRMPVLDGYAATKEIRRLPRRDAATIPIIAMTADAYEEDIKKCLDTGMNGHVSKPILPAKLYQAILHSLRPSS